MWRNYRLLLPVASSSTLFRWMRNRTIESRANGTGPNGKPIREVNVRSLPLKYLRRWRMLPTDHEGNVATGEAYHLCHMYNAAKDDAMLIVIEAGGPEEEEHISDLADDGYKLIGRWELYDLAPSDKSASPRGTALMEAFPERAVPCE